MRIAIDSYALVSGHSVRGIGVMVEKQLEALSQESKKYKNIEIDAFNFSTARGKSKLENGKYNIIHYPYFFPYSLTLPDKKYGGKVVITIQDLIQLIYPRNYPPEVRGRLNFVKQKMRLRNVDAIITISETSKKDIVRFLKVKPNLISVIYLAPKEIFRKISDKEKLADVSKKYHLPAKFVLYVGDVNYNKNVPTLIRACDKAGLPLVICGKQAADLGRRGMGLDVLTGPKDYLRFLINRPHPELAHFEQLQKLLESKKVIRPGFVPDEDLVSIYNLASVYCQPSLYEGFGLIVLEAFACETPVVISKTQALVEIAGKAALVANPDDPSDFSAKLLKVINDSSERLRLMRMGTERVKSFSWEETARQMIEVYRKVAGNK